MSAFRKQVGHDTVSELECQVEREELAVFPVVRTVAVTIRWSFALQASKRVASDSVSWNR